MEDEIGISEDDILGQEIYETMQTKTDYECKKIHMGSVMIEKR
jgi:hypothetical protein